jgi:hypothetical protein
VRVSGVRWAPSDGPRSDTRPPAQMAPAPSEPRDTTLSSRDPPVHRPFGLFADASDLLVFAHGGAPETTSQMERPRPCGERGVSRSHLAAGNLGETRRPDLGRKPSCVQCSPHPSGYSRSSATEVIARGVRFMASSARSPRAPGRRDRPPCLWRRALEHQDLEGSAAAAAGSRDDRRQPDAPPAPALPSAEATAAG